MKKTIRIFLYILFALVLIFLIAGFISRDRIEIPDGLNGEYINISGNKIRYYQTGSGQDLLFIHGLPGSIEDWEPIMDDLSSRYRITFFDRPGHGYSSADNIEYNLAHNAQVALNLIDALKLTDVIVIGHSYGGSIALQMAIKNPPQVRAFVSVAGASYPLDAVDPIFYLLKLPIIGRGIAVSSSITIGPGMIQKGVEDAFYPNSDAIPLNYADNRSEIWLQPKVTVTIANEETNIDADLKRIAPRYSSITQKFIIIHGSNDLLVPKEHSMKLSKVTKNSKLIILEKTGHQVQYARSSSLIAAINEAAKN